MSFDTKAYSGIPYLSHGRDRAGCDCWGLARLVLQEQAGLELESMGETYADADADPNAVAAAIAAQQRQYIEVAAGAERCFDLVLMRMRGQPVHIGIVARPGFMLHIERGIDSVVARYREFYWQKRVIGFYRHAQLAGNVAL